jgi:hypothetical protein
MILGLEGFGSTDIVSPPDCKIWRSNTLSAEGTAPGHSLCELTLGILYLVQVILSRSKVSKEPLCINGP